MDWKKIKKVYMIGIKGVGMTMLAQFLAEKGVKVSGSDVVDKFMTDKVLKKEKISFWSGFDAGHLPSDCQVIIYSSAFTPQNNSEVAALESFLKKNKSIRALKYAEALGDIFSSYQGISVCGSHGKTTTSAWLGYVLRQAGLDPTALVGSRVPQFKGSAILGKSEYFIAETDEYQNKLQYFKPFGVLLNNIDYDHPDFFKTISAYNKVFIDFVKKIPSKGFLVANNADSLVRKTSKFCRGRILSYSLSKDKQISDFIAGPAELVGGKQLFEVFRRHGQALTWETLGDFSIGLMGEHNIYNALAVLATADFLGADLFKVKKALSTFSGTERRCQYLGKYKGADVIDDYAHHPTEIKATLSGLRSRYGRDKKIIVAFHPHTFSRTKVLLDDFSKSFFEADDLVILDIYGSAREKQGGVSSADLVKKIKKFNQSKKITQKLSLSAGVDEAVIYLRRAANKNSVIVLMGAGDIFRAAKLLLAGNKK